MALPNAFNVVETTIADIHAAFQSGLLSARELVQMYLDRIAPMTRRAPKSTR